MIDKVQYMKKEFLSRNFEFDDKIFEQFYKYYEMLIKKNKVMNLTSITSFEDIVVKHFIDSILITKIIDLKNINSIIDIGTGAGFPGIPMKIIFPEKKIVLLDSLNKRVNFLNEVIDELNLNEIIAIHSRAEDLAFDDNYREKFDLVISRAVANLSTLSEYCLPFLNINGIFVSYKSDNIDDELNSSINAVKLLGGKFIKKELLRLDKNTERAFIIIDKIKNTPKRFPRKAGTPSKEPL